ncbi:formate C-acetyltransferase [Pseudoleptotrichia goodfellowii]|uniref:Formate C-acetyltransferase n=1 Tax=Pseudoleptotrichia goodfellowii F0264 TaxID=596323 RepID=D0GPY5_9FUSO|nr:formate C-acetyltransferase [Pseudoleptotrichia goodfellowii]EEY33849.1 formate C-acetyltransferase [Pseudoleptotrichia goodfellowii F0264]
MNERVEFLKKELFKNKREISTERAVLYTQSHKETVGEPEIIRRAKATKNILEKMEISIREKELIAGNRTIKPRSGIISPEMDPYWIMKEIDTMETRPQDQFVFTEKDKKIFTENLYPYWKDKSLKDSLNGIIPEYIRKAVNEKIVNLNQTDKGQGHIIPDFETVLKRGYGQIRNEVKEKLEKNPENEFYKALLITLEATISHIKRYEKLAREMALQEKDESRKKELQKIEEISGKVATEPAGTFLEALQLLWYTSIVLQMESNASSISLGRIDQYLYPYYKNDIEKGEDKEKLKEYLEAFYIKTNDVVLLRSEHSAKFFAGFPSGYTALLGGVNIYGQSAVNELSYLCLEAYHDIRLPQPNLGIRVNDIEPKKFIKKTCETIALGTGIPQLFNDEVVIPSFLSRGVSLEDARDYSVVGCVELSIPGKTYGLHDIAMLNILKIMEKVLYNNENSENLTLEKINGEIKESISYYVKLMAEGSNIVDEGHKKYAPVPLLSTIVKDSLEKGKDITAGGARYNFSGVQGIGLPNLCDSLMIIKKFVFDEKKYTFKEVIEALKNNYEGNVYEKMKNEFISDETKYGNDIDEVDNISAEILRYYCKEVEKYKNPRGGIFIPGSYTVSAHIPLGEVVGATPDGRLSGEQLADGGLSPMFGRDIFGPTAVLKSLSKLDNVLLTNGSLLNVKLSPSAVKTEEGINKFVNFIYAYMKLKLTHIQFNVIGVETLKKAQVEPEKYGNLVVRVAGYSAFFSELNKKIQDDIIHRTEHGL